MNFNIDSSKQVQEVIFSRKIRKLPHPSLAFNNNNVLQASSQKHLSVTLDVMLTFDEHLNNVLNKVNKTIKITIYKAFVRPHLDYGDTLFDQTHNGSFPEKLESVQYNACLALTGAIRGSSKEEIYQEICNTFQVVCKHSVIL